MKFDMSSDAAKELLNFIHEKIIPNVDDEAKKELASALNKSISDSNFTYYKNKVTTIFKDINKIKSVLYLSKDIAGLIRDCQVMDNATSEESEILTSNTGKRLLDIMKSSKTFFTFDIGVSIYLMMVFEITTQAFEIGLELVNSHREKLDETLELLNQLQSNDGVDRLNSNLAHLNSIILDWNSFRYDLIEFRNYFPDDLSGEIDSDVYNLYSDMVDKLNECETHLNNILIEARDDVNGYLDSYDFGANYNDATLVIINNISKGLYLNANYTVDDYGFITPEKLAEESMQFNNAEKLYINYDPIVIDMGKTDFELTSIENGVNFDMDVNNTPFIFHRI